MLLRIKKVFLSYPPLNKLCINRIFLNNQGTVTPPGFRDLAAPDVSVTVLKSCRSSSDRFAPRKVIRNNTVLVVINEYAEKKIRDSQPQERQ
jgi:hypothetical protein